MFYDAEQHECKLEGNSGRSPAACICLASTLQQAKTTVAQLPVKRPSFIIIPPELQRIVINPAK